VSRFFVSTLEEYREHAGLRLDKFLDIDNPDWPGVARRKLDLTAYRMAYRRWEEHWTREALDGRLWVKGGVRGRLAVGLGAKGVLEVGLRLSHTYGTPLIPASAVKGVLRANVADEATASFLFGGEGQMGFADFQDAWWLPENKPPLMMDTITVHHPDYYTGKEAPSDCDSPNPVTFLSVRGTFLFVAEAPNKEWKDFLKELLIQTLEKRGVGAKTAAGYGRFAFA